jgi:hypothetical protein
LLERTRQQALWTQRPSPELIVFLNLASVPVSLCFSVLFLAWACSTQFSLLSTLPVVASYFWSLALALEDQNWGELWLSDLNSFLRWAAQDIQSRWGSGMGVPCPLSSLPLLFLSCYEFKIGESSTYMNNKRKKKDW